MNQQHQITIQFTREIFAALRARAPYGTDLAHNPLGGTIFVRLDRTGNDVHGYVEQVRREPGCDPLVGTATFGRRAGFDEVERIELHGTATEIGEELADYVIDHGATPAPGITPTASAANPWLRAVAARTKTA
jgi:hypothetical protein